MNDSEERGDDNHEDAWEKKLYEKILVEQQMHYDKGIEIGKRFLQTQYDGAQTIACDWFLVMSESEIGVCVQYIADEINRRFKGKKIVLCGILKGAYLFISDLSKHLTIPYTTYFVEASSYGDKQQQGDVQMLSRLVPEKFVGRTVVLLDELFDRGTTMYEISQCLLNNKELQLKPKDLFTCTLFAKEAKKAHKHLPRPDLIGIDGLPDLWLVGYGLDDRGEKRGWKHLFACPKSAGVPLVPHDDVFSDDNYKYEPTRRAIRAAIFETLSEY